MFRSYLYIQTTTAPIPFKRALSALDFQHYFFSRHTKDTFSKSARNNIFRMIKRLVIFSMILAMVKSTFVLIPSYKKMKIKSASRIQSLCKAEVSTVKTRVHYRTL